MARDEMFRAAQILRQAGVENPEREARLLFAHATGYSMTDLISGSYASPNAQTIDLFDSFVARRANREPFAYIVGTKDFFGLSFLVGPQVLIPRPETEILVERALTWLDQRQDSRIRVLEVGVGSGCISLSLAKLSKKPLDIIAIDASAEAIEIAKKNYDRLQISQPVHFRHLRYQDLEPAQFDLIVSNPPYLSEVEMASLQPEVGRYEPEIALVGGPLGHEMLFEMIPRLVSMLSESGCLALECASSDQIDHLLAQIEPEGLRLTREGPMLFLERIRLG